MRFFSCDIWFLQGGIKCSKRISWQLSFYLDKSDLLEQTGGIATSKHAKMGIQTAPLGLFKANQ